MRVPAKRIMAEQTYPAMPMLIMPMMMTGNSPATYARKAAGKQDVPEHVGTRGTEGAGGPQVAGVDAAHAVHDVDHDDEERPEEGHEDHAHFRGGPEDDRDRNPRQRRNRAHDFEHRIDEAVRRLAGPEEQAQRDADGLREDEAAHDAHHAVAPRDPVEGVGKLLAHGADDGRGRGDVADDRHVQAGADFPNDGEHDDGYDAAPRGCAAQALFDRRHGVSFGYISRSPALNALRASSWTAEMHSSFSRV